jgi:hypothetical protein
VRARACGCLRRLRCGPAARKGCADGRAWGIQNTQLMGQWPGFVGAVPLGVGMGMVPAATATPASRPGNVRVPCLPGVGVCMLGATLTAECWGCRRRSQCRQLRRPSSWLTSISITRARSTSCELLNPKPHRHAPPSALIFSCSSSDSHAFPAAQRVARS